MTKNKGHMVMWRNNDTNGGEIRNLKTMPKLQALHRNCDIKVQSVEVFPSTGTVKVKVLVTQPCPTLCHPMNYSPPGSSVHGILQARILAWIAIPFSRESSQPRD